MKILFISDIHGNKYVLDSIKNIIDNEDIRKIFFCGDVVGYYYFPNEIIDFLKKYDVVSILGNHDKNFIDIWDGKIDSLPFEAKYGKSYKNIKDYVKKETINYLKSLPTFYEFQVEGLHIGIFHGNPLDHLNGRFYPSDSNFSIYLELPYDIIVLGHTHHKMIKFHNNKLIINPGSAGQQRDGKGTSGLIFDTVTKTIEMINISFNIDELINDINSIEPNNEKLKEVLIRNRTIYK
jgi:putative phosphoesterase